MDSSSGSNTSNGQALNNIVNKFEVEDIETLIVENKIIKNNDERLKQSRRIEEENYLISNNGTIEQECISDNNLNPEEYTDENYKDENESNNTLENLELSSCNNKLNMNADCLMEGNREIGNKIINSNKRNLRDKSLNSELQRQINPANLEILKTVSQSLDSHSDHSYLSTIKTNSNLKRSANDKLKIIPEDEDDYEDQDDDEEDDDDDDDDEICPMVRMEEDLCHESNLSTEHEPDEQIITIMPRSEEENYVPQIQYEIFENGASNVYSFDISEPNLEVIEYNNQENEININNQNEEVINLDDESTNEYSQHQQNEHPEEKYSPFEDENYNETNENFQPNENFVIEIDEDDDEYYQCVLCPKSYKDISKVISHVICKHTPVSHKKCECCEEEPINVSNFDSKTSRKRKYSGMSNQHLEQHPTQSQATSSTYQIIEELPSTSQSQIYDQSVPAQPESTILNYETIQHYNLADSQIETIENFTGNQIFEFDPPPISEVINLNQHQVIQHPVTIIPAISSTNINLTPQAMNVIPSMKNVNIAQKGQSQPLQQNSEPTTIFKCIHCSKFFTKKSELQRHSRKHHEKQRPYKCNVCEKLFLDLSVLKQHELTHIKEIIIL